MRGRCDRADHGRVGVHAAEGIDVGEAQLEGDAFAGSKMSGVMGGHLGSGELWIDGSLVAADDIIVESVFHVGSAAAKIENFLVIRFVLCEEKFRGAGAKEPALAVLPVLQLGAEGAWSIRGAASRGAAQVLSPGPGVAEPKRGQKMQGRGFRPTIPGGDFDENVFNVGLGVFEEDIEVAVLREDARIEQLELGLGTATLLVFFQELEVRELGLGIFVEHAHVAVCGSGVQIEIALLDILAVVALIAGEAEEPLFEDRILAIPKAKSKADELVTIAEAADAVFAPAIGAGVGMLERKEFPGGAVGAVILPNRAPLAVGEIGAPALPVLFSLACFFQTMVFRGEESRHG